MGKLRKLKQIELVKEKLGGEKIRYCRHCSRMEPVYKKVSYLCKKLCNPIWYEDLNEEEQQEMYPDRYEREHQ